MPDPNSALITRSDSSRTLALGGLLLVISAMLLGEIYAIFISHVANAAIKQAWGTIIEAVSSSDISSIKSQFVTIQDLTEKRGRIMNTHSHMGAFGLLALALVVIQPLLKLSTRTKNYLAWLILVGAFSQLASTYVSYYVGSWILSFAGVAAIILICGLIGNLYGLLLRQEHAGPTLAEIVRATLSSNASRLLLKAGVLLILLGMIFGFYYAWILTTQDEISMNSAITAAVNQASQQDISSAKDSIISFKKLQSKIAITAAAHSHAIEFGILAVLLAFIQQFVMLSKKWCLNWARIFVLGGYLLPVCVYLATHYGLLAAAFADLSGGLVLISLSAMMVGLIRHTGAIDSSSEQESR